MKRYTISIPDDLANAVDNYARDSVPRPPLTAVIQAAVRQYDERGYLRAAAPLRITPAKRGSGRRDVSQKHDRNLARD
jgi:hypothetical protein